MLRRPLGKPKNRRKDDIRNDMKKLKKKRSGLTASRIVIIGNYMLRRAKYSKIEVVAPKEKNAMRLGQFWYIFSDVSEKSVASIFNRLQVSSN
jgi:hypothetical protein